MPHSQDHPEPESLSHERVGDSLVAAARLGSSEALGQLLAGCQKYLLHVANQNLGNSVQAKIGASDVVQETFVQAHQIFDRFHGHTEEELLAWLSCILGNKLLHVTRLYQQTKKRDIGRELLLDNGDFGTQFSAPTHAGGNSPSQVASRTEEAALLQRALATLPARQREVISLRNWEGRSFEQTALLMNCTYDAARKLWARAVVSLHRQLTHEHHEFKPS